MLQVTMFSTYVTRRQTRKAHRKEARKLKKMRTHAFKQGKPVCTLWCSTLTSSLVLCPRLSDCVGRQFSLDSINVVTLR